MVVNSYGPVPNQENPNLDNIIEDLEFFIKNLRMEGDRVHTPKIEKSLKHLKMYRANVLKPCIWSKIFLMIILSSFFK